MARGHQKIQSQAKAQEKAAKMKKQSGHSAQDQKKAAQKALVISCLVCKVSCCNEINLKEKLNGILMKMVLTLNFSRKCQIPRLINSILKISIRKMNCQLT